MALQPPQEHALRAAALVWLGLPKSTIAEKCGVTVYTLGTWMKADWWPAIMDQAQSGHIDRLVGTARQVLDASMKAGLGEDATARDRKTALDAARFVLERQDKAFAPPTVQVNTTHDHSHTFAKNLSHLSVDELRALASRPVEARALPPATGSGEVFDVDYEELVPAPIPATPTRVTTGEDGKFYLPED